MHPAPNRGVCFMVLHLLWSLKAYVCMIYLQISIYIWHTLLLLWTLKSKRHFDSEVQPVGKVSMCSHTYIWTQLPSPTDRNKHLTSTYVDTAPTETTGGPMLFLLSNWSGLKSTSGKYVCVCEYTYVCVYIYLYTCIYIKTQHWSFQ